MENSEMGEKMTPDHKTVEVALESCRNNLKGSKELMPAFFVGAGDELTIISAVFGNEAQKDQISQFVKAKVIEWNADFVLFISEAWVLQIKGNPEDWRKHRGAYDSLADHPDAKEVVTFILETKNRCWNANADILPGRELGKVEWHESQNMDGRFSRFFGNDKPTLQ